MTDTNPLPPLPTPKFTETIRGVPCVTVTEHEHLMRAYAMQASAHVQGELEPYDAGLLNNFGGGNVEWWQDYIRAELGRAHDFYQSQMVALRPVQVPMTDAQRTASWFGSPVDASWAAEDAYNEGIQDAEAHHGITAQAKKEAP